MLDDICEQICSYMAKGKWISLSELSELVRSQVPIAEDAQAVTSFMERYMLEVDLSSRQTRLNPWAYKIFQISTS